MVGCELKKLFWPLCWVSDPFEMTGLQFIEWSLWGLFATGVISAPLTHIGQHPGEPELLYDSAAAGFLDVVRQLMLIAGHLLCRNFCAN